MKRYDYSIWQLPISNSKCFIPISDDIQEVFLGDYVLVYDWETNTNENLERIYERLNINHPIDFHARSLSVSDLIYIRDKEKNEEYGYLVDVVGFQKVKVVLSK